MTHDPDPTPAADTKPAQSTTHSLSVIQERCLIILAFFAVTTAFYFGREFFVPIALAVLLSAMLRPIVRWAKRRWHVPPTISALIIVLTLIGSMGTAGYLMSWPIENWVSQLPATIDQAKAKIDSHRSQINRLAKLQEKVQEVGKGPSTQEAAPPPTAVAPPGANLLRGFFGTATALLGALAELLLLVFLILSVDDLFTKKLVRIMPTRRDKAEASQTIDEAEGAILRFVLLIGIINACQGVVVTLIMWALHMPSPWLWGIATLVFEFIPYIGATVMVCLLAIVSIASANSIGGLLIAPISYLIIATIQSSVASPIAYGKQLKMNPVAILLGVLFWWFIWGVPGAFMAVPIVATLKIIADRSEHFEAIGEFLGE